MLTVASKGMKGAIAKAQEIVDSLGDKAFMLQQFENPDNPKIHVCVPRSMIDDVVMRYDTMPLCSCPGVPVTSHHTYT